MSTFNLGLPTDIPWKRICFTKDMTHKPICGHTPPPKWRSSIAVFEYEPETEYQILLTKWGLKVSYLKISVTITPDAQDVPIDYTKQFIPRTIPSYGTPAGNGYVLVQNKFPPTAPCYGAMMQVSLGPKGGGGTEDDIYFADFEPKKRELYESVTHTGEFASGSSTRLAIGKSGMTSEGTESFSSRSGGFNLGLDFPLKFIGENVGGKVGESFESGSGTRNSSNTVRSDITSTDASTERREVQSHSTQLSQMYNLFQSFHLGTNRAMFFMEPRPHIVIGEATFINGPRALEGIQEVFLVVVRKQTMTEYCVNVILETAHLENIPVDYIESKVKIKVIEETLSGPVPDWALNEPDRNGVSFATASYSPEPGWEIDVEKTKAELPVIIENHSWDGAMGECSIQSITAAEIKLLGKTRWHTFVGSGGTVRDPGRIRVSMTVHLKLKSITAASKFYLTARNLCCCPQAPPPPPHREWDHPHIVFEKDFKSPPWTTPIGKGPATPDRLREGQQFASSLRDEMVGSLNSPYRLEDAPIPFEKSNVFFTRVLTVLKEAGLTEEIEKRVGTSTLIPVELRRELMEKFGDVMVADIILMTPTDMSLRMEKPVGSVLQIKEQILRAIANVPVPTPVPPLPTVVGVRIGSSYPDPNNVRTLLDMTDPLSVQGVDFAERPNIIEVTFSEAPDPETVNAGTFTVTRGSVAMSAQITQAGATTVRLALTDPVQQNDLLTVRLKGSGEPSIKFGSRRLDGDPKALPSGDGIEGGDFTFVLKIRPLQQQLPAATRTLLKVMGVEIGSTVPDPAHPVVLARMMVPTELQRVYASDSPNIIDVTFNEAPDTGTVTSGSFTVSRNGAFVPATVAMLSAKVARLTIGEALQADAHYIVTLNGKTSPAITYQGYRLDGEGNVLPSGNDAPGGDFSFVIHALRPIAVPPSPLPPSTLLKVGAVRFRSSVPDPGNPRLLFEMIHPGAVQEIGASENPDTIDIDFNLPPDAGTVSSDSFMIMDGVTPLPAVVTQLAPTSYRLKTSAPLIGEKTYSVVLDASAIGYQGSQLDGEPVRLPSGDGIPGMNFTFDLRIV